MSYSLFRDLINLAEEFETDFKGIKNIKNFSKWLSAKTAGFSDKDEDEPEWEGKSNGRTPESVISSSIIHLFRYAKVYSKIAIADSPFTTIDEVIFLINLLYNGSMTKIQLISINIHEKSTGIQIINRLVHNGFVRETVNVEDKRSKKIEITEIGKQALSENMDKIRKASRIVAGDLNYGEKMQLIGLLQKLEFFHSEKLKTEINLDQYI